MVRIILKLLLLLYILLGLLTPKTLLGQEHYPDGKSLFGDLSARQIGPALMSGRVTDVELHPQNPEILFIGSAGGGVWKSKDGGMNFTSVFDDYAQSIGCVTIDPNDPDHIVWVGTGETWTRNSTSIGDGIYKSTDGGTTWKKKGLEHSERISSILVRPGNSQIVYAGVLGALWGNSTDRGVYQSTDGGEHWQKILYINERTGCSDLVMDPHNPDILYAAFWEFRRTPWSFESGGYNSGLYKSVDAGKTWKKIHNGFPGGKLGRIAFAVAPTDSNRLYAVLETEHLKTNGLWRSDDAGKSWTHLNNDFGLVVRPFYFSRIVVDPKDKNIIAKAGLSGSISRDGGKTFKSFGFLHSDIHDIAFGIHNSSLLYVATDGGLYRSCDSGDNFEIVENLPLAQYYQVSVDNDTPYHIYGGLQDNGSWYGPSESPGGIRAKDWVTVGYGDGFRVFKHPEKNIIYTEMQGAESIWRYDADRDRIKNIQPEQEKGDPKLRYNWNAALQISHHRPDRLYVGSQFLYRSDDMGDTWEKISPDLTTDDKSKQNQENSGGLSKDNSGAENHCTIFTISESPFDENLLWVGTDDGQVQLTKNGGKKWKNLTKKIKGLPPNLWCYHLEASVHDRATAYAVFDGHTLNDKNAYVYKTTDYGKTWQNIATGNIKGPARSIVEDPVNPSVLYLGTEFGLYITLDGGKHWLKFENNMPSVPVHALVIQKKADDLVMGTHGRGIIILDDLHIIRRLGEDVLQKEVYVFQPEPMVMKEKNAFVNFFGNETQFTGANPPSGARFFYYLKKKHIFGKMQFVIKDTAGKVISRLTPGKSKGINEVSWNFRIKPPKIPKGKTMVWGGFNGPRVSAGKYTAVLIKGKKEYEIPFEVRYDENGIPLADRHLQEKTTMKLYDMIQDLAYLVYRIDLRLDYLKETEKKDIPAAATLYEAFNTLKKTLVITTGDNYVATAEPELREKIVKLYGDIVGAYEKPGASQLRNLDRLVQEMEKARNTFDKLNAKTVKLISKNKLTPVREKSFEEFVN